MKLRMTLAVCMMAIALGGCASSSSGTDAETTSAAVVETVGTEETVTVDEGTTEEESSGYMEEEYTEEESSEGAEEESSGYAEDPGYTEEDPDDFLGLMDDCADVNPYSSGSSLRAARAAAQLLDWTEDMADLVSADGMKVLVNEWKESRSETEWENLKESWGTVASVMMDMAVDPEGQSELLADTNYTLGHDTYRTDVVEMVTAAIAEALEE